MKISILHISDIHLTDEAPSKKAYREAICKRIEKEKLRFDCIVISGDLFNCGTLNKRLLEDCREYFNLMNKSGKPVKILVVPGNHDLNRAASTVDDAVYNKYTTRRELVFQAGDSVKNERCSFTVKKTEQPILYHEAFRAFFDFSRKMGFETFNESLSEKNGAETFEVQKYDLCFGDKDKYCIRFVLLNTALIAGQAIRGEDYKDRIRIKKEEVQSCSDAIEACRKSIELLRLQESFEKNGELVIDEEVYGNNYNEESQVDNKFIAHRGRLSLSKKGFELLKCYAKKKAEDGKPIVLTVFIGHHGFQYFSDETQKNVIRAIKECGSGIYLCGHAHRHRYKTFKIGNNSNPKDIGQFQAGVLFEDDGGFAQYGFNHIQLHENNGEWKGTATAHCFVKGPSGEMYWMYEPVKIDEHICKPDVVIVEPPPRVAQPENDSQRTTSGKYKLKPKRKEKEE